ncbi:MAG: ABC-ATPase domain-containing protein [Microcoleus sp. PH2017_10_PVI_O_A]|uniref:ABC-ATPase domain-containing protein n=1 Tax=unclassified Microcoleus TaxID=2642155 RepID=UPI001DCB67CB|nr:MULTISPECIES: ABC-ATPase domain-containing protein [unclassified Microcoleus]TAE85052.1 MAG: ATPase [Oscillatoriales cyanobacterium]MCC3404805.1 ABC-ATPase domain-containing protein [Microcoleus sp. PH2017_10_PVI_O_A]MCC3458912.1 ABC-ATPase domain-containing protein [Microcoleus sp. PH2017_11_PCY_U_A]MCC3477113.1 ABC-ATPase domain-containing protein [Microcoleus sp. PH2017_12_PCY_D_A]MCC3526719.1 ABC-ATPase domain-containing protein [Microcoleus sp. PH2017_21_RUC_O_A]
MTNKENLKQHLLQLDNRSYKAYKDIQGSYDFPEFTLIIDYVQGDPFASPSKFRVKVPPNIARIPRELFQSRSREIALGDYLTRQFDKAAYSTSSKRGSGKSGTIAVTRFGQEVLERTSAFITPPPPPTPSYQGGEKISISPPYQGGDLGGVEIRFSVGLPAGGRSILGRQAAEMLCEDIPRIVSQSLKYSNLNAAECRRHVETVEDADWLRQQLAENGLVAFVADGAILPRRSGVDNRPLLNDAVAFVSPPSLKVEFNCPNRGLISGMGIPAGITLIVGGGYHGKSTLLRAIELGVYNRIPGDGREFVVTSPAAVKIRAEDGRSVAGVDISPFINHLPQGRDTVQFYTANASGSTSQAANIIEALEVGRNAKEEGRRKREEGRGKRGESRSFVMERQLVADCEEDLVPVLLVDEDRAATNFMIRDRRMQELIAKDKEPITPFIDKVKQLYADCGVSTILVMGGSGDYFDVADTVISMDNFAAYDVTEKAKEIANNYSISRAAEGGESFGEITHRVPVPASLDPSRGRRDVRVKVRDVDELAFGIEDIDLGAVEQIVDSGQLRAIASAMVYAKQQYMDGKRTLSEIIDLVMADIDAQGMDILSSFPEGDFAMFRRFELAAAINRLRSLSVVAKR